MLGVFRFRKFTESRWVTVGEACRRLIASQMVGLPGLVDLIRKDEHASDYYIHGYWVNMNSSALRFAVLAGLASRPVDALLLEILKDNRLAGRLDALELCMEEEFCVKSGAPQFPIGLTTPEGYICQLSLPCCQYALKMPTTCIKSQVP